MTKEKILEFTLRISSANKTEMVVILYDIALEYIQDAKDHLEKGELALAREEMDKLRGTMNELMNSVNASNAIGENLIKLYVFCNKEITNAYIKGEAINLDVVEKILSELRASYYEISSMDMSKPVMEHAEVIYSGFTYNRKMQGDSFSNREINRGFLV